MRQARRNRRRFVAARGFKSGLLKYTRINYRTGIDHDGRIKHVVGQKPTVGHANCAEAIGHNRGTRVGHRLGALVGHKFGTRVGHCNICRLGGQKFVTLGGQKVATLGGQTTLKLGGQKFPLKLGGHGNPTCVGHVVTLGGQVKLGGGGIGAAASSPPAPSWPP